MAIFLSSCSQYDKDIDLSKIKYDMVITTGLTDNDRPYNAIEEACLCDDSIYIYVAWKNLPKINWFEQIHYKKYNHKVLIFDEEGSKIFHDDFNFRAKEGLWNSWSTYHMNPAVDLPGKWKVELYLNDNLLDTQFLRVLPGQGGGSIKKRNKGAISEVNFY